MPQLLWSLSVRRACVTNARCCSLVTSMVVTCGVLREWCSRHSKHLDSPFFAIPLAPPRDGPGATVFKRRSLADRRMRLACCTP
jgi:hypothetical protein